MKRYFVGVLILAPVALGAAWWLVWHNNDAVATRDLLGRYCTDCHNSVDFTAELVIDPAKVEEIAAAPEHGKRSCASCGPGRCRPRTSGRHAATIDASRHISRTRSTERRYGAEPGRAAAVASAHANRVPQHHSRPARDREPAERARLRAAATGRQLEQRLRQHRRAALRLAGDHGALPRGRSQDQPARGRRPRAAGHGQHPQDAVHLPQDDAVAGLPLGTRGGLATDSYFPLDAEYSFKVQLERRRASSTSSRSPSTAPASRPQRSGCRPHRAPRRRASSEFRVPVDAGPHRVGATFVERTAAFDERTVRPHAAAAARCRPSRS